MDTTTSTPQPVTSGDAKLTLRRFLFAVIILMFLIAASFAMSLNGMQKAYAAPMAQATQPLIVISQIYGAGGNTGAIYQNDFVEIFNRGDVTVNLSGYSVQYAPASTVDFNVAATLVGTIEPGQYLLVGLKGGTNVASPMPSVDITSTATMNASDGKVILVSGLTALPCYGPDCTTGELANIVDGIGYGSSNYYEGTGAAPAINNVKADFRLSNGCDDSNNNSADFSTNTPAPRNSNSTFNYCTQTATPTATFTDTETATSTSTSTETGTPTSSSTVTNTGTLTNTNTPTSTGTKTSTPTKTATSTNTGTPTSTATPSRSIVINEVAWMGTQYDELSEWIELYNPGSSSVTLTGWKIIAQDGSPSIDISPLISIEPGEYLIIERKNTSHTAFSNLDSDMVYTGALEDTSEILFLRDSTGTLIDSANNIAGNVDWPAGNKITDCTMERANPNQGDLNSNWFTYAGILSLIEDPSGSQICGSPKGANWAYAVTRTPSPTLTKTNTPTKTKTPTQTRTVTPTRTVTKTRTPTRTRTPVGGYRTATRTPTGGTGTLVLNEILPHASTDWNGDGVADTNDEYIEIMNLGPGSINIGGWKLDDKEGDSAPYTLPSFTLAPGEKRAFFGSTTRILLGDDGDIVRLIKPSAQIADSFTYSVVRVLDQTWCRMPDGTGAWVFGCKPTIGSTNSLTTAATSAPTIVPPTPTPPITKPGGGQTTAGKSYCPLVNVPAPFGFSECDYFGLDIWRREYLESDPFQLLISSIYYKYVAIIE